MSVATLRDAIEAVRSLHARLPGSPPRCRECLRPWPCPTLAALDTTGGQP